ncbi:MAG: glycosyl transferase, partial [Alphaproteobacteria bacterium]|nr:glycosyl transferase [Alphaproteobacteria bacterium]
MDEPVTIGLLALSVAALSAGLAGLLTGRVLRWVQAARVLAEPEARSSHTAPTPVGGGLAVMSIIAAAGLGLAALFGRIDLAVLMLAAAGLAVIGWTDDRRGLSPATRLAAQAAAVLAGLAVLEP